MLKCATRLVKIYYTYVYLITFSRVYLISMNPLKQQNIADRSDNSIIYIKV